MYSNIEEIMNYLFFGKSTDLNIGNGKTVSAVGRLINEHLLEDKIVYSNIQLIGIPYIELNPYNIYEVIETDNAIVLFDELHAIIDIHHKVSPHCKHHITEGACFDLAELFRQVRKKHITTLSTVQSYSDCVYRLKVVMQENIICEKYDISTGRFKKCIEDNCPSWHIHRIMQTNYRTWEKTVFDPTLYFGCYDSSEIVRGWQHCKVEKEDKAI
jgi:hypothetical protein